MSRLPHLFVVLTLVLLPLTARAEAIVTVYSTTHREEDRLLFDLFTHETGIKVDVVDDEFDTILERLTQERAKPSADVLLSIGAATLTQADAAGLLQPMAGVHALSTVPPNLRDRNDHWVGLAYWARVIAYRKDKYDPADIATYEDLADPKYQGELLVRSGSSPYNQALVASIIASNGIEAAERWSHGVVANLARPPQGGDGNQLQAINDGEGSLAVVNTGYWSRYAASDKLTEREIVANIGIVFPNQANRGTQVDIIGAGILRAAPHARAAASLVAFLLRPDIQEKLAAQYFVYPVRAGVPVVPALAELGTFKMDKLNVGSLGRFAPEARQAIAKADWD